MTNITNTLKDWETKTRFCQICDNHTPFIWVEVENLEYGFGCQICFEAYGVEMMEFQKG